MGLICTFSEGLIQNVEELRECLILIVASLKLLPIYPSERQVLEKDNHYRNPKWVYVCLLHRIPFLFEMSNFRWAVHSSSCCVMHPGINGLTVSNVNEGQYLLVWCFLRKDDIVRFDITVRDLIFGVQIKKGNT